MRLNDLSDGSIKALLILALLVANLIVASFPHPKQVPSARKRNDEFRMTKVESMTRNAAGEAGLSNDQAQNGRPLSFLIGSFLRHSTFGIRH